jgi:hypothetical protein
MTQLPSTPQFDTPVAAGQPDPTMLAIAQLARRVSSGASNFYWVAALSVINTLMSVFNAGRYFVIGLAISLLVDGIFVGVAEALPEAQLIVKLIDVVISVVIAGVFALFGYLAIKGKRWAFIVGMVLYAFDALLMLAFQEWIGLIFHLFFLWGMFGGLQALSKLQKFMPQKPVTSDFPQNIGVS